MLVTPDLIARLESCDAAWLARAVEAGGGDVLSMQEGVAAYAGNGNVLTQAVGFRSSETFGAVLDHFRGRCETFEFKVSPLAEAELRRLAAVQAVDLPELDSVMVRALDDLPPAPEAEPEVEELSSADVRDFVVHSLGWFYPQGPPPGFLDTITSAAEIDITRKYVVRIAGVWVAGASLTLLDGVAFLHGGAVDPAHRGKGFHKRLIAHRLRVAAELGAELAAQGAQPGSISQQNAQRLGFRVAYTRPTLLVKP